MPATWACMGFTIPVRCLTPLLHSFTDGFPLLYCLADPCLLAHADFHGPAHASPEFYGLGHCKNAACARSVWQRDVNAAYNMLALWWR